MEFSEREEEKLVEAIEEGRIVLVPEFYAKSEGLPILRKPAVTKLQEGVSHLSPGNVGEKKEKVLREYKQEHSNWRVKQVVSELVENFHWVVRMERKKRGITRRQMAKLINEPEEVLQEIENGVLRSKDFVVVNKIQQALGINLRKDQRDYSKSAHDILREYQGDDGGKVVKRDSGFSGWRGRVKENSGFSKSDFSGDEIEILEDEL